MFEKVKTFANNAITKGKLLVGVVTGTVLAVGTAILSGAEGGTNTVTVPQISESITTASFNGILDQMTSILPIVLPVIIAGLAFRKGISFLMGLIRGI